MRFQVFAAHGPNYGQSAVFEVEDADSVAEAEDAAEATAAAQGLVNLRIDAVVPQGNAPAIGKSVAHA